MSQAIVDPDALREFAASLKRYTELVADATGGLESQFAQLSETWRDQEQAKFAAEFEQTIGTIRRFHETSEEFIPILLHKAESIDEYLGR